MIILPPNTHLASVTSHLWAAPWINLSPPISPPSNCPSLLSPRRRHGRRFPGPPLHVHRGDASHRRHHQHRLLAGGGLHLRLHLQPTVPSRGRGGLPLRRLPLSGAGPAPQPRRGRSFPLAHHQQAHQPRPQRAPEERKERQQLRGQPARAEGQEDLLIVRKRDVQPAFQLSTLLNWMAWFRTGWHDF